MGVTVLLYVRAVNRLFHCPKVPIGDHLRLWSIRCRGASAASSFEARFLPGSTETRSQRPGPTDATLTAMILGAMLGFAILASLVVFLRCRRCPVFASMATVFEFGVPAALWPINDACCAFCGAVHVHPSRLER
jgi:hypothetical protein